MVSQIIGHDLSLLYRCDLNVGFFRCFVARYDSNKNPIPIADILCCLMSRIFFSIFYSLEKYGKPFGFMLFNRVFITKC